MSAKKKESSNSLLKGSYYTASDITVNDRHKRLKALAKLLETLEQDADTSSLAEISRALVNPALLGSKDANVSLLTACCLADIIRVYAPDAPYDDDQLKRIFTLFIDRLSALSNSDGPRFKRTFYLLERLSIVKAFILLVDLDDQMVVRLFSSFMNIVGTQHSSSVKTHMLDIMLSCVEETEHISPELLEIILRYLTRKGKEESEEAYKLTQTLIGRCAEILTPYVSNFLNAVMEGDHRVDSELKESYHELIFELNRIDQNMLLSVMPKLESELKVEDEMTRFQAVNLLIKLFGDKDSKLGEFYKPLYFEFWKRFNDQSAIVRQAMVTGAKYFVLWHGDTAESVTAHLKNRLVDTDEKVRQAAVECLCVCAAQEPARVASDLLEEIGQRMLDKKASVRHAAISNLAAVFTAMDIHCEGEWDENMMQAYGWIPRQLLRAYFVGDNKAFVTRALHREILGVELDVATRTQRLLDLIKSLDDKEMSTFEKMLLDKRSLQTEFAKFLSLHKKRSGKSSVEMGKLKRTIAKRAHIEEETLNAIQSHVDTSVITKLNILCEPRSTYTAIREAQEALSNVFSKNPSHQSALSDIVDLISMMLVGSESIPTVLDMLSKAKGDDCVIPMRLIQAVSKPFPQFFSSVDSFMSFVKLLDVPSQREYALRMLSQVAGALPTELPAKDLRLMQKRLLETALSDNADEAKLAVVALSTMENESKEKLISGLLKKLSARVQEGLPSSGGGSSSSSASGRGGKKSSDASSIISAMKASAYLATNAFDIFEASNNGILSSAAEMLSDDNVLSTAARDTIEPSEIAVTQGRAVKLLTRYLCQAAVNASEKNVELSVHTDLLGKLFRTLRACQGVPGADAALLRRLVASAGVKLAQYKAYESILTPRHFLLLCTATRDTDQSVRRYVLEKLDKLLQAKHPLLPLRYLALLTLYADDDEKELLRKARESLNKAIKLRSALTMRDDIVKMSTEAKMTLMPENAVPHVIYVVAHQGDLARDMPDLRRSCRFIEMFFDAVLNADNFTFIQMLVSTLRNAEDATAAGSKSCQQIAEVTLLLLDQRAKKQSYKQVDNAPEVFLPSNLFSVKTEKPGSAPKSTLPPSFQLPTAQPNALALTGHHSRGGSRVGSKAPTPLMSPVAKVAAKVKREKEAPLREANKVKKEMKSAEKKRLREEDSDDENDTENKKSKKGKSNNSGKRSSTTSKKVTAALPANDAADALIHNFQNNCAAAYSHDEVLDR